MAEIRLPRELPVRYVADEASLKEVVAALPSEGVIGLDTETLWDHSSKLSRVSLIQIATAEREEVFVIDALALDLEPLRALVESPSPSMVAHNARFDQMVLSGAGFKPSGLVDTLHLARTALTLDSYSLASVSEHLIGIPLDKTLRTSNWKRRPLTKAQINYAAKDARVVLIVYEELKAILQERGAWESALRAATSGPVSAERRPRTRRPKQELSPPLTKEEMRVVNSLKVWRLALANTQHIPAYMICPDKTLEHLARSNPESLEALGEIYGLGASKISRFGADLLKALREACEGAE